MFHEKTSSQKFPQPIRHKITCKSFLSKISREMKTNTFAIERKSISSRYHCLTCALSDESFRKRDSTQHGWRYEVGERRRFIIRQ